MSQAEKAAYWRELKDAGVQMKLHYREYSTDQLQAAVTHLRSRLAQIATARGTQAPPSASPFPPPMPEQLPKPPASPQPATTPKFAAPDTVAGIRQNTRDRGEPIRVDEQGRIWYQDEVRKPAFPKPRGRRVLKYDETGTKTVTINGAKGESETFEMPGEEHRVAEARITLPSYQVGVYKDPRYPFLVHIYNEEIGFDLFEVEAFWGGADLVPSAVKRKYVSSTLCYDIRTTVREIEEEARRLKLEGKIA